MASQTPSNTGFANPAEGGGAFHASPVGDSLLLNVIISGESSPAVLSPEGFGNFLNALGFKEIHHSTESRKHYEANLGDGQGYITEITSERKEGSIPVFGHYFQEDLVLRFWMQKGFKGENKPLFVSAVLEKGTLQGGGIDQQSFDKARDKFVSLADGTHSNKSTEFKATSIIIKNLVPQDELKRFNTDGDVALITVTVVNQSF